ncbi:MAG: ABC transporter permease [Streptosporangiaceae bacterium]
MSNPSEPAQVPGRGPAQPAGGVTTPDAEVPADDGAVVTSSFRRRQLLTQELILLVILAVMIVIFGSINHNFVTRFNLVSTVQDSTEFAPLAVGELFVLITGGVDLSVGAILGFAGVIAALVARAVGGGGETALIAAGSTALAVGLVCGLVNGLMIVKIRISPFVATLAMLGVAGGLTLVVTGAVDVTPLPVLVSTVGNHTYLGVLTIPIIITIIVAVIGGVILHYTVFGRWTYAIGSNRTVARECGINVRRHLVLVYVLSGVLAGLAGFLVMARLGIGSPSEGANDELNAIVAVVIGGASLFGGRGSMVGSMIGTLMLSVILSGLIIIGVQPYWQTVVTGLLLAIAVAFQTIGPARTAGEEL